MAAVAKSTTSTTTTTTATTTTGLSVCVSATLACEPTMRVMTTRTTVELNRRPTDRPARRAAAAAAEGINFSLTVGGSGGPTQSVGLLNLLSLFGRPL